MENTNETIKAIGDIKIDLSYLNEVCGGDQDFVESIIATYLNDIPNVIEKLASSCANSEWQEVGKVAHQLKPSLQFVGLQETLNRAKTIERTCKQSNDLMIVPELVNSVVLDVKTSFKILKQQFSL